MDVLKMDELISGVDNWMNGLPVRWMDDRMVGWQSDDQIEWQSDGQLVI